MSAVDPRKNIQFIIGLDIIIKRLNIIKRTFKQVIIEDSILYILFCE